MKLKQLFAITAIASALVLTGCKEDKKPEAAAAPLNSMTTLYQTRLYLKVI